MLPCIVSVLSAVVHLVRLVRLIRLTVHIFFQGATRNLPQRGVRYSLAVAAESRSRTVVQLHRPADAARASRTAVSWQQQRPAAAVESLDFLQ